MLLCLHNNIKMESYWSSEAVLKLINLYRENSILYDVSAIDYRNRDKKRATVQKIAELLGKSVTDVQKKWDNLRTQFLKELKNAYQKEKSGAMDYVVKWRYFHALSFLQKTQNKRSTIANFQLPTYDIKAEPDACEEDDDHSLSTQSTCHETDFGVDSNDNTDKSWQVETHPYKKISKKRKIKERGGTESEKTLQIMGKYFEKKATTMGTHNTVQEEDEDDLFSRFLVVEMKKVKDPNVQRTMKRKLIDLVMDAQVEEERRKCNQENTQAPKQGYPQTVQWDTLFGAIRQSIQQVMIQNNSVEQIQPELFHSEPPPQQPQCSLNLSLGL